MGTLTDNLSRLEEIEETIINEDNAIVIDDSVYAVCDTSIVTTRTLMKTNLLLIIYKIKELLSQLDNQPYEIDFFNQGIGLHYVCQSNNKNEYTWITRTIDEDLWLEINNINTIKILRISNIEYYDGLELLGDNNTEEEMEVSLTEIDTINKIINEFLK